MTLGEQQRLFVKLIGELIEWTYIQGYEFTFGDAYRDPRIAALNAAQGKGIANSLHSQRLAVDFNLFLHGVYLPATEDYRLIGDHWKTLHPLCRWGGDFTTIPDGNHFSMEWAGVK